MATRRNHVIVCCFKPSKLAESTNFGVDLGVLVLSAAEVSDADAAVPSNRAANLDV